MLMLTIQAETPPTGAQEALSIELLEQVKQQQPVDQLLQELADLDPELLAASLHTDAQRIAFWVNIYHAHIIIQLREQPDLYARRRPFFRKPRIRHCRHGAEF
jgi:tRNA A37 N6-isopentenylltransferase MiaA